jgi:hypothetical protein
VCTVQKIWGKSKKIFTYLAKNQSKILKFIRHNNLEKIKYLSLRAALELALNHLNFNKENRYFFKKKIQLLLLFQYLVKKKSKKLYTNIKMLILLKLKLIKITF